MKKTLYTLIAITAALSLHSAASAQDAMIIPQSGSPIEITDYSATYQSGGSRYSSEGVKHAITLTNTGDQTIEAYRITFRSFDVFNEDMGRGLGGISIQTIAPGEEKTGTWIQKPYAAFSFEGHGTGVAYVDAVRLADGTVWSADQTYILSHLQKIQEDLTADIFENSQD